MIYTPQTKAAMLVCFHAHKDQLDKGGMPYVFHPFHVADQMPDELTTTVALLHDVVEDSGYTLYDLREIGFSDEVLCAVAMLTHDRRVPYMEYIKLVKEHPVAKIVKLADLRHNSDLSRLDHIDEKDEKRAEKYKKAIALLEAD